MEVTELTIKEIRKNPYQPRQTFDEDKLSDLMNSILTHGVMQPVTVRKAVKGYTLVAGERRLRASEKAGLTTIPAIITEMSDKEMMELAIIENLQREDLNPLEEAESYKQLMVTAQLTQDEISKRLGKSRSYIANMLRLLNLPAAVKRAIDNQKLSSAHGRTLLSLKEPLLMEKIALEAIESNMSVRTLEAYVKAYGDKKKYNKNSKKLKFLESYENKLKEHYGTNVEIKKVKNKGMIQLEFTSEEEFKRILAMLQKK